MEPGTYTAWQPRLAARWGTHPGHILTWLRTLVYLRALYVLINVSSATLFDQVNGWNDFRRVEHDNLIVPPGGGKFLALLLFMWRCSPDIEVDTLITMTYECSDKPPFIARDI